MVLGRSSVAVASFLFLSLFAWRSADAAYCYNVNGGCNTACPGAISCYTNEDCAPGGVCIVYEPGGACAPGSCTCEPSVPGQWYWSCQLICLGYCNNEIPDSDNDGMPDRFDNCPSTPNAGQKNADQDLDGDACDCAPNNATLHRPPAVTDVRVHRLGSGWRFHWSETAPADRYEIQGNELGVWSPGQCLTATDPHPTDADYEDSEYPPQNSGRWFLFRGVSNTCGPARWGTLGTAPSCP